MTDLMAKIISLTRRRGFVYLSSEIYGGFSSCYDFGPLGVALKNNIKKSWWEEMTQRQEKIIGLDAAILMSPKVWQASGHLTAGFADELTECKKCHHRFRKDFLKTPLTYVYEWHNPINVIENSYTMRSFAPLDDRIISIIKLESNLPGFLDQAIENLKDNDN